MPDKYPPFPKNDSEMTIENIIRQYPKTDDCELQTLGELREWQIKELNKLFELKIKERNEILQELLNIYMDVNDEGEPKANILHIVDTWMKARNLISEKNGN